MNISIVSIDIANNVFQLHTFWRQAKSQAWSQRTFEGVNSNNCRDQTAQPCFRCPRIALMISNDFGIEIDKDVVRRVLATHYILDPDNNGPSWLSFIADMKDSLWSIEVFRCESITLQAHWVLIIMDQWSHRILVLRYTLFL